MTPATLSLVTELQSATELEPAEAVRLPLSDHRALVVPCGPA